MVVLIGSPNIIARKKVVLAMRTALLLGSAMTHAHRRRIQDSIPVIEQANDEVVSLRAVKKRLVVHPGSFKDFAAKGRGSFSEPERLEFRIAMFFPVARMAPLAQPQPPAIGIANPQRQHVMCGPFFKNSYQAAELEWR